MSLDDNFSLPVAQMLFEFSIDTFTPLRVSEQLNTDPYVTIPIYNTQPLAPTSPRVCSKKEIWI